MVDALESDILSNPADAQVRWRFGRSSLLLIVLAFGLLFWIFRDGIRELLHLWDRKEEYSHAYLLPFISLFLFWQKKHELAASQWQGSWAGVAAVVLGLLLFFLGTLSAIFAVIHYALFLTIAGLVLSFAGASNFRYLWAGLVLLFFAVPFPQFLYQALSTWLQLISSELGVAVIRFFGVSVFLEGNVIDLGSMKLQVIEACNGLRYLFPLSSFGFLCAYLYKGPWWHRVVLILSTIPITVLMNSFRIGVIGYTVDRWGQAMAEGFLHDFEGWAIFMACLFVLFCELAILARLQRPPQTFADAFFVETPGPTNPGRLVRVQRIPLQVAVSVALLLMAATLTIAIGKRDEIVPVRKSFSEFPLQLADWKGRPDLLDQIYIDALKFTDYLMVNFSRESDKLGVNFYVAYYDSQRAGESAHSPRSCIPGGGWKIEGLSQVNIETSNSRGSPQAANRVQIVMGENRQLVYYWFQQRGRIITSEYLVKWYLLWDSLTRNRSDGGLVRITTSIPVGARWEDGDKTLHEFIKDLGPGLDDYVPN